MRTFSKDDACPGATDSRSAWKAGECAGLRFRLEGDGATDVVLIHELGGSLASWDGIVPALASSARLLRYDQRGQGRSHGARSAYTLDDQIDDLHALLDAVPRSGPQWLIGAAAGASVAVGFATQYPQAVAGIVMCSPALVVDPSRRHYLLDRGELATREGMGAIVAATMDNSWPPVIRTDVHAFARYRAQFLANDATGYALASQALSHVDLLPVLPTLRCPCLMLAGEHDLQRPPALIEAQAARVPGARFAVVPASGHLMAVQQPAAVAARILAFISGHSR